MRHPQLWVMPSTILLWQTSSYNPETSTALSYTVNNFPLTNIKLQSWNTLDSELYRKQFSSDKHQAITHETPSALRYNVNNSPLTNIKLQSWDIHGSELYRKQFYSDKHQTTFPETPSALSYTVSNSPLTNIKLTFLRHPQLWVIP
jgi:GTPase SAR1 family protein